MNRQATKTAGATFVAWLVLAPTALAQRGTDIGNNIGDIAQEWAGGIFFGILALFSVYYLLKRDFTQFAVFLIIGVLVGGLVLVPESAEAAIKGLFRAVTQ